jgi:hypothetical protein
MTEMGDKERDETARRKERLAAQLRANLKRRKEQARARSPDAREGGESSGAGEKGSA